MEWSGEEWSKVKWGKRGRTGRIKQKGHYEKLSAELFCIYPTLPYPTLPYTTLHYTTLHYTTLHCPVLYRNVQKIQTFFHTVNTFPEADSSLLRMFFNNAVAPVSVCEEMSEEEKKVESK